MQGVYYTGFHRGATQLGAQVMGALFALGWSFAWSLLLGHQPTQTHSLVH